MKLAEITSCIEAFAPLAYQESYDNAGLICGYPSMEITGALICLDSTEAVLDEAIEKGFNLVVAHHPIVFSGLKKFNGKNYIERVIIKAIKHDIAIYVAHTNLDNVQLGVNAKFAERLGLFNTSILAPKSNTLKKLITFCPVKHAGEVRKALFSGGAGSVGDYSECSFTTVGKGTFKAGKGTNPFVGTEGVQHQEDEERIEVVYPAYLENKLVGVLKQAHPYEEVAFDLVAISNKNAEIGSGMIGELPNEMLVADFFKMLKIEMKAEGIRYTNPHKTKVKKIALCGGSGSFLLNSAIAQQADVFVTADFKYHQFFDADKKVIIADIGHYETEQFTMELFYEILTKKFNTFAILISRINTNPIKYL